MNLLETITGENYLLGNIANVIAIVLFGISILTIAFRLARKVWISFRKKHMRPSFLSEGEVDEYTKIYIKTRLTSTNPILTLIRKSYKISKFIRKHLIKENNQYHWILGESGMGKTAFLINLYFFYNCRVMKKYKVFYVSLRDSDSINQIQDIAKTQDTTKSIMLLDAFDESSIAIQDPIKARKTLENETKAFCKVVITSRTQFFDRAKEIPQLVEVKRSVSVKKENYVIHYICPFSNFEIIKYLVKRYKVNLYKIIKARKLVSKSPLMARPFLLSYIDDFIGKSTSNKISNDNTEESPLNKTFSASKSYKFTYQIYGHLIYKWIEREAQFVAHIANDNLHSAFANMLIDLTKMMLDNKKNNNEYSISVDELNALCVKHGVKSEFSKRTRSLLIRVRDNTFQFTHQSILEYLLADIVKNRHSDIDINDENLSELEQYRNFIYEMSSDYYTGRMILSEATRNEKILLRHSKTMLLSVAIYILLLYNVFSRAPVRELFGDALFSFLLNEVFLNFTAFEITLVLMVLILHGMIIRLVLRFYHYFWLRSFNVKWDISGEWHIIQIKPEQPDYIKIGTVLIRQNYYNIQMMAEVYGVSYCKQSKELMMDDQSKVIYVENSEINERDIIIGTSQVTGRDRIAYGFHQYFIESHIARKRPIYIRGWFFLADENFDTAQKGYRMMFRSQNERNQKAKEICSNILSV